MRTKAPICLRACLVACLVALAADSPPRQFKNDFESQPLGKAPDDIMVLDGTFTIAADHGNKYLELAPDPVGEFGALLGPAFGPAVEVKARVWSAAPGKRFPEFGIGAGDAGGVRLFVAPARHVLEIRNGEATQATAPLQWKSGQWTWLRLRIEHPSGKQWLIRGKAWPQDQGEPNDWTITTQLTTAPPAGRVSFWGEAFSEQPIRFDDLSVTAVE